MNAFKSGMEILKIFKQFDKNGDGKITEEDFALGARQLGLGSAGDFLAKQVFSQLDTNRNGKLDMDEILKAVDLLSRLSKSQSGGGAHA